MPSLTRTNLVVLSVAVLSASACGVANPQQGQRIVDVRPEHSSRVSLDNATTETVSGSTVLAAADRAIALERYEIALRYERVLFVLDAFKRATVAKAGTADNVETPTSAGATNNPPLLAPAVVPATIASVMACIRGAESGNYSESHNPGGATGAYQYEGATFVTYEGRWAAATGYAGPTYGAAYEAPPWMQDAITAYTLQNGGAGNWSEKYGADSCTSGLSGGG